MEDLKGKLKMKDWKTKILELDNRFNSFKESTTERLETHSNKMVTLEALIPRVTDLESKIIFMNKYINENQQVKILNIS